MMEQGHADRILNAVRGQANQIPGEAGPERTVLIESWKRCIAEYGLEPHRIPPAVVLTPLEVRERLDRSGELLAAARGEIDRLFQRVNPESYVVRLSDADGVIIDFRCSERLIEKATIARVFVGSVWREEIQGTTAIGLCRRTLAPLSIVMGDHFSSLNADIACTVAPIFGADNELAGVLNVTSLLPTDHGIQALMREMVIDAARRIENLHFSRRNGDRMLVALSQLEDFADTACEGRLAADERGCIIDASKGTFRLLRTSREKLIGSPLQGAFGLEPDADWRTGKVRALGGDLGRHLYAKLLHGEAISLSRKPRPSDARDVAPRQPSAPSVGILGEDPVMRENIRIATRLMDAGVPILLNGESGSGKGVLARILHDRSARARKPFVTVNCAAIPRELIESELFGYRPGAFTGAASQGSAGRILEADGGTLFLDEIGDMPLELQTRLLQVLSDGEFVPVGGTKSVHVDVCLISASLRDIERMHRAGTFREDLYFRLSGATLCLPPLRQRRDKRLLIERILIEEADRAHSDTRKFDDEVLQFLEAYHWPGNLRELRYTARYAIALADGEEIHVEDLPPSLSAAIEEESNEGGRFSSDRRVIDLALKRTEGNISAAAELLGISRSTLHRRLKFLKQQGERTPTTATVSSHDGTGLRVQDPPISH